MVRWGRWWLTLCLLSSAGCDGCRPVPPPGPAGPPTDEAVAGISRGGYLLPFNRWRLEGDEGVTEYSIVVCGTAADTTVFAVWIAGPPGQQLAATSSTDPGGYHGEILRSAGEPIRFSFETTDGMIEATIGGRRYDLAAGRLFLVALRPMGDEVRQLDRPLPDRAGSDKFFDSLRGEAELKEFFAGTGFLHRQKRSGP